MGNFKFNVTSTNLTDYTRAVDNAKLNPYFDESMLNTTSAQKKVNYVYGMAAMNNLTAFRQEDFSKDIYNNINRMDKEAGFSYLMYKAFGEKNADDDTNFMNASEHYKRLYEKEQMSSGEKFSAGMEAAGRDVGMFFLDVVDSVVDSPFVATTLVADLFNKNDATWIQWMKDTIASDYIAKWATGGKTIDEFNEETRLNRFYETDQFATMEDAVNGFNFTDTPSWGNVLDFFGSAAGSLAKMCLNYIPVVGQFAYWGLTAAEIGKEDVVNIDNPYARILSTVGKFGVEYVTEMIFADSFIDKGLIQKNAWIPASVTGIKFTLAKMGVEATTNAIEEMAAEILDTMLNQSLYTNFDMYNALSAKDKAALNPQWETLLQRTLVSGLSGALVGLIGAANDTIRTGSAVTVDEKGNKIKSNIFQNVSDQRYLENVRAFSDPSYERTRVYDKMAEKGVDPDVIFASQEYVEAVKVDEAHQKEFTASIANLQKSLAERGYTDSVETSKAIADSFARAAVWMRNYEINTTGYRALKAPKAKELETKGKREDVTSIVLGKEKLFAQHYNGRFTLNARDSSLTNPELAKLAKRSGYDAIIVGDYGSPTGKTTKSPYTVVDNTLFVESDYFNTRGATRALTFRNLIVNQLAVSMSNEAMFSAVNNSFYKKMMKALKGNFATGDLAYTKLIAEMGSKEAHKYIVDAILHSPSAMRFLFVDDIQEATNFCKALAKNYAILKREYGNDAESMLDLNYVMANIINNGIDASVADISTFNKPLAESIKQLADGMPLAQRLDFITKQLGKNMIRIRELSKNPDMWLLRDLGFYDKKFTAVEDVRTTEEGKLEKYTKRVATYALNDKVADFLDSTNFVAMGRRQLNKDFSIITPSKLSAHELATVILQSEDVQRFLGLSDPKFRDIFMSHLASVITYDKTPISTKQAYLSILQRFVTTAFALSRSDVKAEAANFVLDIHQKLAEMHPEFAPKSNVVFSKKLEVKRPDLSETAVVDKDGKPLVVYHGSPNVGFRKFDRNRFGSNTGNYNLNLFYFTNDAKTAESYTREVDLRNDSLSTVFTGKVGEVRPFYLNVKNPLDLRNPSEEDINNIAEIGSKMLGFSKERIIAQCKEYLKYGNSQGLKTFLNQEGLKEYGYDGVISNIYSDPQIERDPSKKGIVEYGVVNSDQIVFLKKSDKSNILLADYVSQDDNFREWFIPHTVKERFFIDTIISAFPSLAKVRGAEFTSVKGILKYFLTTFIKEVNSSDSWKAEYKVLNLDSDKKLGILSEFSEKFATYVSKPYKGVLKKENVLEAFRETFGLIVDIDTNPSNPYIYKPIEVSSFYVGKKDFYETDAKYYRNAKLTTGWTSNIGIMDIYAKAKDIVSNEGRKYNLNKVRFTMGGIFSGYASEGKPREIPIAEVFDIPAYLDLLIKEQVILPYQKDFLQQRLSRSKVVLLWNENKDTEMAHANGWFDPFHREIVIVMGNNPYFAQTNISTLFHEFTHYVSDTLRIAAGSDNNLSILGQVTGMDSAITYLSMFLDGEVYKKGKYPRTSPDSKQFLSKLGELGMTLNQEAIDILTKSSNSFYQALCHLVYQALTSEDVWYREILDMGGGRLLYTLSTNELLARKGGRVESVMDIVGARDNIIAAARDLSVIVGKDRYILELTQNYSLTRYSKPIIDTTISAQVSIPELSLSEAVVLNKTQQAIVASVQEARDFVLATDAVTSPNVETQRTHVIKEMIKELNSAATQEQLNKVIVKLYTMGDIVAMFKAMPANMVSKPVEPEVKVEKPAVKKEAPKATETGKSAVLNEVKPVAKEKPEKKAKVEKPEPIITEQTTFKAGDFLKTEDYDKAVIRQVLTTEVGRDGKIAKVQSQGFLSDGKKRTAAVLYVYKYQGRAKELDIVKVSNFAVVDKDSKITSAQKAKLQTIRAKASLFTKDISNYLRVPVISESDALPSDLYATATKLGKERVKLIDDFIKFQTEMEEVMSLSELDEKTKSFEKKMSTFTSRLSELRAKVNDLKNGIVTARKDATEEERAQSKKEAEEAKVAYRKEQLDERIATLEEKRQAIEKAIAERKLSEADNLREVLDKANAYTAIPEYALLAKMLTNKVSTVDNLKKEIEANPDIVRAFHKFLAENRGYANVRRALRTVLGENYTAMTAYLDTQYANEYTKPRKEAEVLAKAENYKKLDINALFESGELEDVFLNPDSGLETIIEQISENKALVSKFMKEIISHKGMYDKDGILTKAGQFVREELSAYKEYYDFNIPDVIKVEKTVEETFKETFKETEKQTADEKKEAKAETGYKENLDAQYDPFSLNGSQQEMFDKLMRYIDRSGAQRIDPKLKPIIKMMFNYSGKDVESEIKTSTQWNGITSEMLYDQTLLKFFSRSFGKVLDQLSNSDWLGVLRYLHYLTQRRVLPTSIYGNIMNLVNYFGENVRMGVIKKDVIENAALGYANLIRETFLHDAGSMLAKGKVAKQIFATAIGNNAPEAMRSAMVAMLMEQESITAEEANDKVDKVLRFKLDLQLFAEKLSTKMTADEFYKLAEELLIEEQVYRDDNPKDADAEHPYKTARQKVADALNGIEHLNTEAMNTLYSILVARGEYGAMLFIQEMYQEAARQFNLNIKMKDMFSKDPLLARAARKRFTRSLTAFRFMSMLSNPSVIFKNKIQNRINAWSERHFIDPASGKVFEWLSSKFGEKIRTTENSKVITNDKGQFLNFAYDGNRWVLKETVDNRALATTYLPAHIEKLVEAGLIGENRGTIGTAAQQINLVRPNEISQATTDVVKENLLDNHYLDYIQANGRVTAIDKETFESFVKRSNPFKSKTFSYAYNTIYNLLEGDDRAIIRKQLIYYLENIIESQKLYELKDKNKQLFADELDKAVNIAFISSLEVVYKSDTKLFHILQSVYEKSEFARFLGSIIVPFPRVSSNVLMQIGKYSPFGLGMFVVNVLKINRGGVTVDINDAKSRALLYNLAKDGMKGAVGTALYTLGALLAALGYLRIDDEKDYHGIVLYFGDNFRVDISTLSVMANPLLIGATLAKLEDGFPAAMEAFFQEFAVLTFLGNIFETFQTYKLTDIPQQLVESYVLSFIPSILKTVYKFIDPYEKDYTKVNWFKKVFLRAFPMFAPNKVDPFTGEDQKRYTGVWVDFINAFSPAAVYSYPKSETEQFASEYGITSAPRTDTEMSFDGQVTTLTKEELIEYNKQRGKAFRWLVTEMAKSSAWKKATQEEKVAMLEKMKTYAVEFAKVSLWINADSANYYAYTENNVLANLMKKYMPSSQIRLVDSLKNKGVNYYGTWN